MESPDEDIVESLVAAIEEHREFRELSCYSVECLGRALEPRGDDNPRWRDATERAAERGAAEIVLGIMEKYPGHDDALGHCSNCLAMISSDSSAALAVADRDGLAVLFGSIECGGENLTEWSISRALSLVERAISHPDILSRVDCEELVSTLVIMGNDRRGEPSVCLACVRCMGRLSKSKQLRPLLAVPDVIKSLLAFVELSTELGMDGTRSHEGMKLLANIAVHATRILLKLCSEPNATVQYVQDFGATSILLALVASPVGCDDDVLKRLVARLISQLNERTSSSLIGILQNEHASLSDIVQNLDLLHLLAMYSVTYLDDLSQGDLRTLLRMLGQNFENRVVEALSEVMVIIGGTTSGANKTVGAGGLKILADMLSSGDTNHIAMIAAIETLNVVLLHSTVLTYDMVHNLVWTKLSVLSRYTNHAAIVSSSLKCLSGIFASDRSTNESLNGDDMSVIAKAMKMHYREEKVQTFGTKVLLTAFSQQTDLSQYEGDLKTLCDVAVSNTSRTRSDDLLLPSLQLLHYLVEYDTCRSYVKRKARVNALSNALVKNFLLDDVTSVAVDLVTTLSSRELIQKLLEDLSSFAKNGCMAENTEYISSTIETIGCLTLNSRDMLIVDELDGFNLLISAFERVTKSQDHWELAIASSLVNTFAMMVWRSKPVREQLDATRILAYASKILRSTRHSLLWPCLQLSRDVYALCDSCNVLKSGMIDGISVALSARESDVDIQLCVVDLLIALAKDGYGSNILKTSAVRQMQALVRQIVKESGPISVLGKVLAFIGEIGKDSSTAEILKQCGSIDTVINVMGESYNDMDLAQLGYTALYNMVTATDVAKATDRVKRMALKSADSLSLLDVRQAVIEMGILTLSKETDDQSLADRAVDTIFKVVKTVSPLPRSPSLIHLNTTCLEMVCRLKTARYSVLLLTDLAESLLCDFETNSSMDLCRSVVSLSSNKDASFLLPNDKVVALLLALIQKSDLDLELAGMSCKSLLALCKQNASSVYMSADLGAVYHVCDFIANSIEQKSMDAVEDALRLLVLVGERNPNHLIGAQVINALSDILAFRDGFNHTVFSQVAKVILIIASEASGLRELENNWCILGDSFLFVLASKEKLQDCGELMRIIACLAKSDRLASELKRSGFMKVLAGFLRDCPVESATWPVVAGAFYCIETDDSEESLSDTIDNFSSMNCSPTNRGALRQYEAILERCCDSLLRCDLDEAQFSLLSHYMVDTLESFGKLRSNGHYHWKIRSLCLSIYHRMVILRVANSGELFNFAVQECNTLLSEHLSVYRSIAYALLSSVARVNEGMVAIVNPKNISGLKDACLLASDKCQVVVRKDQVYAENAANTVTSHIVDCANEWDDEMGAQLIGSAFTWFDDTSKRKICQGIIKSQLNVNMLFGILGTLVQPGFELGAVQVIVDVISQEHREGCIDSAADSHHIGTVTTVCRRVPSAVFLFSFFVKNEDGINALATDEEPLKVITWILSYGDESHQYAAASVLSDFLAATPILLDSLKKLGVPVLLLRILRVPSESMSNFVQDSMHVIGTLVSHFGSSELNLNGQWEDCLENILKIFGNDDYISGVATDILSDLRQRLNEDDDIAGSLGVLASALTGTECAPRDVQTEAGNSSIEPHFMVMDQLRVLLGVADNIDTENVSLDTQLATPLIEILGRYKNERTMIAMALRILLKIGDDKWAARVIEERQSLGELVDILKKKNDSSLSEMVLQILACVPWKVDYEKEVLMSYDTIASISQTIVDGYSVPGIVESGFCAVSNLLSHSSMDANEYYNKGGLNRAFKASISASSESHDVPIGMLQSYYDLVKATRERDVFREIPELVSLLNSCAHESLLVSLILRILGFLSVCDANVLKMIKCNTVSVVVGVTQQHYINDAYILQLAVMILSNFGTVRNEEEKSGIICVTSEQGGQAFLVRCIGYHRSERALMDATLQAMFNLGNLNSSSVTAFDVDVMRITLEVMIALEYDPEVLLKGLKIVTVLSSYEGCHELLNEMDGISFLVNIIARHIRVEDLVELACLSLANALMNRGAQDTIRASEHKNTCILLDCLEARKGNLQTTKYLLAVFALLARKGIALDIISRDGLHLFVRLSQRFLHDRATTEYLVEIIGQISFAERYIPDIIQTGCIKLLLHILNIYTNTQALVIGVLRSILIILKSSDGAKVILSEAGGQGCVEQAVSLHSEKSIQQAGEKILQRLRDEEAIENYRMSFIAEQERFSQASISLRGDLEKGGSQRWSLLSIADLEGSRRSLLIPV
uniref:Uncharacterized protein n=1 Tax=Odontella aurita TaxID=265563 RepID=A0A7S4NJ14_9STRA|mmetsp:Transcript_8333/g.25111  ORF Transcript_8333/g.25111 Transcript_8333/m.25111 type:complete len:2271 (+) Transcript_8333:927-7739(+)